MLLTNLQSKIAPNKVRFDTDWVVVQTKQYLEDVYELKEEALKSYKPNDILVCCTVYDDNDKPKHQYHIYYSSITNYIKALNKMIEFKSIDEKQEILLKASKALNTQLKLAKSAYIDKNRWLQDMTKCWGLRIQEKGLEKMKDENTENALINMEEQERIFYPSHMYTDNDTARDIFYKRVNYIRANAIDALTAHHYDGPYSVFNYELKDGQRFEYRVDDDLGIPYSLQKLESVKEKQIEQELVR